MGHEVTGLDGEEAGLVLSDEGPNDEGLRGRWDVSVFFFHEGPSFLQAFKSQFHSSAPRKAVTRP